MKDKTQATKCSYLSNPDHVERAYRQGFLIGSRCACLMKPDDAINLLMDICAPIDNEVGQQFIIKRDETSSAFLRGFSHGVRNLPDWIHECGDPQTLKIWFGAVCGWTYENPLVRKESAFMPPMIGNWTWNELAQYWIEAHSKKGV